MNRYNLAWLVHTVKLALPYSAYIFLSMHSHSMYISHSKIVFNLYPLAWEEFGVHLCFACSLRTNHDSTWTTSKHKLQHWKHPLMTLIPHLSTKHPSCSNGPLACFEIPPHYMNYLQHTSCWLIVSRVAKVQDVAHKPALQVNTSLVLIWIAGATVSGYHGDLAWTWAASCAQVWAKLLPWLSCGLMNKWGQSTEYICRH